MLGRVIYHPTNLLLLSFHYSKYIATYPLFQISRNISFSLFSFWSIFLNVHGFSSVNFLAAIFFHCTLLSSEAKRDSNTNMSADKSPVELLFTVTYQSDGDPHSGLDLDGEFLGGKVSRSRVTESE